MTKEVEKFIHKLAINLPAVKYAARDKRFVSGSDLILAGHDKEDKNIDPEGRYEIGIPFELPVNHERRLKRAYKRNGKEGLIHYLKPFTQPDKLSGIIKIINTYA